MTSPNEAVDEVRFNRLPLYGRVLIGLFAFGVVLELVSLLGAGLAGGGDPRASSYSTRASGLGAYAELLESSGHDVERVQDPLAEVELDTDGTLLLPGVSIAEDEADAVEAFVSSGGRLVVIGVQTDDLVRRLLGTSVGWEGRDGGPAVPLVPLPETSGVNEVLSDEWFAMSEFGPAVPILSVEDAAVAAVADVGRGRVVMLGSVDPLRNIMLAEASNAAFGLAIAGPAERPVYFAEGGQGPTATGIDAIPSEWKWALLAGLFATLLAMWSAGRRFGPPEDEARDLPPPRKAYVDAVASTLVRTKQPDASLAPLRRAARERVARRAVLPPDASDEQLRKAAVELGLPQDEIDALFGAVTGDDKAMAVARAMARLGGTTW